MDDKDANLAFGDLARSQPGRRVSSKRRRWSERIDSSNVFGLITLDKAFIPIFRKLLA